MFPIADALLTLQFLFVVFYIGQKLHSNLLELSDEIYQLEWHRYPRSLRRCAQLMMIRAQRPFYLSAYGIMPFTLANFVRVSLNRDYSLWVFRRDSHYLIDIQVLKGVYSAIMLLRKLDWIELTVFFGCWKNLGRHSLVLMYSIRLSLE